MYHDEAAADKAVAFFPRYLTLDSGKPFELEAWQEKIVRQIFGNRNDDGTRAIRRVYCELAKGQGKTTWLAGILAYLMFCDGKQAGEYYSCATKREQSALIYNRLSNFIRRNPKLKTIAKDYEATKKITLPKHRSFYLPLAVDARGSDGLLPQIIIIDEFHQWTAADSVAYFNALQSSLNKVPESLLFIITNSGFDRTSLCWRERQYAEKVFRKEISDPSYLAVLDYVSEQSDKWDDPAVWKKCNPSRFTNFAGLQKLCDRAKAIAGEQATFERFYISRWTDEANAWIQLSAYDQCDQSPLVYAGEPVYCGLDLSSTTDLTSLTLLWNHDGQFNIKNITWLPDERLEHKESIDRSQYRQWYKDGWLRLTDGNVVDYGAVRAAINELATTYNIIDIAIDRNFNAVSLSTDLQADGFEVFAFGQGFTSMTSPTKEFERLVLEKRIKNEGNPLLRYAVGNTITESDAAGNLKPSKKASYARLDPVCATIMALGRYQVRNPAESNSISWGIMIA